MISSFSCYLLFLPLNLSKSSKNSENLLAAEALSQTPLEELATLPRLHNWQGRG